MTAAIEDIAFEVPIFQGELVEVTARVVEVGRTSMRVRVEVRKESPIDGTSELCTVGHFTMISMPATAAPPSSRPWRADGDRADRRAPTRPRSGSRAAAGRCCSRPVLGSGMAFLDGTVVNVALPRIGEDLDAGVAGLQWIVNGYTLTLAALILLGGSLGDRFGRRRIFVLGVVVVRRRLAALRGRAQRRRC